LKKKGRREEMRVRWRNSFDAEGEKEKKGTGEKRTVGRGGGGRRRPLIKCFFSETWKKGKKEKKKKGKRPGWVLKRKREGGTKVTELSRAECDCAGKKKKGREVNEVISKEKKKGERHKHPSFRIFPITGTRGKKGKEKKREKAARGVDKKGGEKGPSYFWCCFPPYRKKKEGEGGAGGERVLVVV